MAGRWKRGIQITIDVLLYVALSVVILVLYKVVPPARIGFLCDDPSIRKPFVGDTVTLLHLIVFGQGVAILTIVATEALQHRAANATSPGSRPGCVLGPGSSLWAALLSLGVLHYGLAVCMLMVWVGKLSAPKLRPHFLATCRPHPSPHNCTSTGYIAEYNCTNSGVSEEQILDAYQSFPSGHAAYAAYIAVYMVFMLHHRVTPPCISSMLCYCLQASVACVALFTGLSRVKDDRHDLTDVLAGFVLGAAVAACTLWCYGERVMRKVKVTQQEREPRTTELSEPHSVTCHKP